MSSKKDKATLTSFTLLGDIHGKTWVAQEALRLTPGPVIQLGDFGLADAWRWAKSTKRLHILGGNHDDYDVASSSPRFLGDFGDLGDRVPGASGTFFVRGAYSIERLDQHGVPMETLDGADLIRVSKSRRGAETWLWGAEEISAEEVGKALELYTKLKPHTILSHDCPYTFQQNLKHMDFKSRTNDLLQAMFDVHQPDRWFFAHYNYPHSWQIGKTLAVCLGTEAILTVGAQPSDPTFIPNSYPKRMGDSEDMIDSRGLTRLPKDLLSERPSQKPSTPEIGEATVNAQSEIFDTRDGVTIRTHYGGYSNRGGFRFEWSDLRRAQCFSDGTWYCITCNKIASEKREREECHECRDWNGCGQDCTLSEIYCKVCGAFLTM